ncbi:hypothetical protein SAMN05443582_104349 [Phyllobacterium sp. OV277]|jgi:hypothetical protein|nr:hypothetical protein SAMN05443582_104349 [Phyllobacterium sp. OV277]
MKRLVQGIEDEACVCRPACPPANDATSEDVDDMIAPLSQKLEPPANPGRFIYDIQGSLFGPLCKGLLFRKRLRSDAAFDESN